MALTISVGFVVDDAIVMLENITRYIEEGEDAAPRRAKGLARDRLHSVSISMLVIAVLIPLLARRHHRPAVPGICGDAVDDDRRIGRGVPDADADDGSRFFGGLEGRPSRTALRSSERGFAGAAEGYEFGLDLAHPNSSLTHS